MSYGTRSFAITVRAPPAPFVERRRAARAVAVLKGAVYGPPAQSGAPPSGRIAHIIGQAAAQHASTYWDVVGPSQKARAVRARWLALVMLRTAYPKRGLIWLGHQVNRDHTTVLFALRRVAENRDRVASDTAMARSRGEAEAEAAFLRRTEQRRLRREETIWKMEEARILRAAKRLRKGQAAALMPPDRLRGKVLDVEKVTAIKALIREGWRDSALGRRFGTCRQTICHIRHGHNWADVP